LNSHLDFIANKVNARGLGRARNDSNRLRHRRRRIGLRPRRNGETSGGGKK